MADLTGQRLGSYRLVERLGHGGFAQVYLGEHLRLGTQAAIKLLTTRLADDDVEHFLAEARIIARLEHPHIIRILDFAVEQDIPFLVMSYAPNGTLRQRHPKGTRLPPERILPYLKQAADALQYAHDSRVVHRDIKPENLLLGRHHDLLLSDFGIAVVAHSSRSQATQEIVGTVAYMAPEQIQGKPRPASDQYALGVIAYEWLCGALPFHGTTAEISMQHLHAAPPSLREQQPDLPPAVEGVVLKALEKDPHQRFASVQEFAQALEDACQSVAPTTIFLPSNPTHRLSASMPAPTEGSLDTDHTIADKTLQPAQSRTSSLSRRRLLVGGLALAGLAGVCGGIALLSHRRPAPTPTPPGTTLVIYTGHLSPVASVAWSPDSARLASGGQDGTVQVWDARSGRHPFVYRGHTTNINAVAWAPPHTGPRIASASGNSFFGGEHVVQLWNALNGTLLVTYTGHTKPVRTVAWAPEGGRLASGGEDNTVQVWEASKSGLLLAYLKHTAVVVGVGWSSDGLRVASASNDTTVQVWEARTGTQRFSFKHTSTVNALAWSPDGTRLASASGNVFLDGEHAVQVWDALTGAHLLTYQGHPAPVSTLAWSPDGTRLASASAALDKTVQVWDARSGTLLYTYRGHTLGVNDVAWSPDGQLIASASNDGTVHVWQAV